MNGFMRRCFIARWKWPSVLLASLLLWGCQGGLAGPRGDFVPSGNRILLSEGRQASGLWQTRDLSVRYRIAPAGDSLEIEGSVVFDARLSRGYQYLDRFHLRLYFVDGDGIVLDTHGLITASQGGVERGLSFRKTLVPPAGTAALALGYTGTAMGIDRGGSESPFWDFPTKKL